MEKKGSEKYYIIISLILGLILVAIVLYFLFHEYFTDSGVKTLRSFSSPLNLHTFKKGWEESGKDLWDIDRALDKIKHYNVVPKQVLRKLRKADIIEREAGKIVEYKKKK